MQHDRLVLVLDKNSDDIRDIREALENEGARVAETRSGEDLLAAVQRTEVDFVIMDVDLNHENGFSVLRKLRAISEVPVVFVTGRSDVVDKVLGLELGADDYLVKPFNSRELVSRVRAVMRRHLGMAGRERPAAKASELVAFSGWVLDLVRRELMTETGERQVLTSGEYDMLKLFVTHANEVLTRDFIKKALTGHAWSPYDRTIDMQIRRLRQKVEHDPLAPRMIKTVRGIGYVFTATIRPLTLDEAPVPAAPHGGGQDHGDPPESALPPSPRSIAMRAAGAAVHSHAA